MIKRINVTGEQRSASQKFKLFQLAIETLALRSRSVYYELTFTVWIQLLTVKAKEKVKWTCSIESKDKKIQIWGRGRAWGPPQGGQGAMAPQRKYWGWGSNAFAPPPNFRENSVMYQLMYSVFLWKKPQWNACIWCIVVYIHCILQCTLVQDTAVYTYTHKLTCNYC